MSVLWSMEVFSAFAVVSAALWRMRFCSRPLQPSVHRHAAWLGFGFVHMVLLMSAAMRLMRLLSGADAQPFVTAVFYLCVAIILAWPPRREWGR